MRGVPPLVPALPLSAPANPLPTTRSVTTATFSRRQSLSSRATRRRSRAGEAGFAISGDVLALGGADGVNPGSPIMFAHGARSTRSSAAARTPGGPILKSRSSRMSGDSTGEGGGIRTGSSRGADGGGSSGRGSGDRGASAAAPSAGAGVPWLSMRRAVSTGTEGGGSGGVVDVAEAQMSSDVVQLAHLVQ